MLKYQRILLAIDLHPDCDKQTASRAIELANAYQATLSILHVVEHVSIYGAAQAYPTVSNLEEQLVEKAQQELAQLSTELVVAKAHQFIRVGSPKVMILRVAEEIQADLIVVGSHGRHGLGLLLGSTANSIMLHAPCDVLAVRVAAKG